MKDKSMRTKSVMTSTHFLGKVRENFIAIWIGSPENRVYGNSAILNHYAGVSNKRIRGRLQHGWPAHSPQDLYYKNDYLTTYLWNEESEIAAKSFGWKNFTSIGAPWLYLLRILERDGWRISPDKNFSLPNRSLWVYGRHLLGTQSSASEELLAFLREANLEAAPGDFCLLYFEDFDSLSSIEKSQFENLQIVTLGQRSSSFISDSHLVRLYHLLKSVSQVNIDHPSSLVLYALSLDVRIFWLHNSAWQKALEVARENRFSELEEFLSSSPEDSLEFKSYALKKLGVSSLKSEIELRRILLWENSIRNSTILTWIYVKTLLSLPKKFLNFRLASFSKSSL